MNICKEQFQCRQCGNCCRIAGNVHLLVEEIEPLALYLGVTVTDFTETYATLTSDRSGLILKENPDKSCILLDENGRCRVNPVKPTQCQTFPFTWTNKDSATVCPALAALYAEASSEANTPRSD